ncbi:MAG: glycoside hydrolase family 88 protein [Verrucomicrobiota bacterium]|nr:glycoside hydrolase family 88 protein [Verrucomicrobiota bacterium]
MRFRHVVTVGALALAGCVSVRERSDPAYFSGWPAGAAPEEVGLRIAERFLAQPHSQYGRFTRTPKQITYPDVCAWYGSLEFAKETGNAGLLARLAQRFEPLFGPEAQLVPPPDHVDNTVFGAVPLELYLLTREPRYLALGRTFADAQWAPAQGKDDTPEARAWTDKGFTWQTRLWIDDMFMVTMVQAQAFRALGERVYIDRAAREMALYLDELQRPNGLFYHAPDVPFFWGRGNGWMAAGTAELLRSLPEDNPDRPRILAGYRAMMAALLRHQAEDGMWRQLIDDAAAWPETSGTGMFAFAMVTGVKNGWLDARTYGPAARRAWLALVRNLDENSDIRDVCEGTNKKADHQYYLDRKRVTGDLHGQAPVVWCAAALLR